MFKHEGYTNKVDIWATAIMYHEMLFGEIYFIGKSHMEVANNVMNKTYIIKKCLKNFS